MVEKWPADSTERRAVAELVPYARNARTHTKEQIAQIAASITEFGWTTPVLLDEAGGIIAGHGRVMAAKKLGLKAVPCMTAAGWTEEQKRAYVLADNQLALSAGWDADLLKAELNDLADAGYDIGLIGFGDKELSDILGDGISIAGDEEDGAASGAGAGDFLKFGKNRVALTDIELESLNKLLARYVEIFSLTHGFARWLTEGKHLA